MPFVKADSKQAFLKLSFYGPSGAGKTLTSLLIAEGLAKASGKRVAYVDTETGGTHFYALAVKDRAVHPAAFDFDRIETKSLAKIDAECRALDLTKYGVLVVDSMTHVWEAAINAYTGKRTKIDSIPLQAWGSIKKPFKDFVRWAIDAPIHVILCSRQANVFETGDDGELKKVGVRAKTEGETPYETHVNIRLEAKQSPEDSTRTTYYAFVEKDRSGVLAGRTFANPTFKLVEPILPLLGSVQLSSEDPSTVAEADGELLDKEEAESADKEERSKGMLAEFHAKIAAAKDLPELAVVAGEIKKAKRKLLDEHRQSLLIVYQQTQEKLAAAVAPKGI